jgi:hypothetical protein
VSENEELKRIFTPKKEDVVEKWIYVAMRILRRVHLIHHAHDRIRVNKMNVIYSNMKKNLKYLHFNTKLKRYRLDSVRKKGRIILKFVQKKAISTYAKRYLCIRSWKPKGL